MSKVDPAQVVISGEDNQTMPRYSPDGQFLVYLSAGDGEQHIWMQPASFDGARWDISRGFGNDAKWSPDGTAIYYRSGSNLMKVEVSTLGDRIAISNPEVALAFNNRLSDYDLLPDGSGILRVLEGVNEEDQQTDISGLVDVVYNWTRELNETCSGARALVTGNSGFRIQSVLFLWQSAPNSRLLVQIFWLPTTKDQP